MQYTIQADTRTFVEFCDITITLNSKWTVFATTWINIDTLNFNNLNGTPHSFVPKKQKEWGVP